MLRTRTLTFDVSTPLAELEVVVVAVPEGREVVVVSPEAGCVVAAGLEVAGAGAGALVVAGAEELSPDVATRLSRPPAAGPVIEIPPGMYAVTLYRTAFGDPACLKMILDWSTPQ